MSEWSKLHKYAGTDDRAAFAGGLLPASRCPHRRRAPATAAALVSWRGGASQCHSCTAARSRRRPVVTRRYRTRKLVGEPGKGHNPTGSVRVHDGPAAQPFD